MTIGISLSGGGARGIAHIGVLKALEENGIHPEVISGASAGAIVGVLYAAGITPDEIFDIARKSNLYKIFQLGMPHKGITNLNYLRKILKRHIPSDNYNDLEKIFYCSISNLNTGESEVVNSGSLYETVTASCSIPLVFQPVPIGDTIYVDGGLLNNLPAQSIRSQSDYLIGVNVIPDKEVESKSLKSVFDIAVRCFHLSVLANSRSNKEVCDTWMQLDTLEQYNLFQFNKTQEIFDIGYNGALDYIPEMLEEIQRRNNILEDDIKRGVIA